MNYRYLPDARRELDRGMEYYEEKSVGLGGEFLDEVEAAILLIPPEESGRLRNAREKLLLPLIVL